MITIDSHCRYPIRLVLKVTSTELLNVAVDATLQYHHPSKRVPEVGMMVTSDLDLILSLIRQPSISVDRLSLLVLPRQHRTEECGSAELTDDQVGQYHGMTGMIAGFLRSDVDVRGDDT